MRTLVRLMATAAVAATAVAMTVVPAAAPAMADPPSGTTVHNYDLVGVGSDTIESVLDQLSHDYNGAQVAGHHADSATNPYLYSWDATNPSTGVIGDMITLKKGCAAFARPDGSGAGIGALTTENKTDGVVGSGPTARTTECMDFARSSRDRATTDPAYLPGGIAFTALAGDAVTYATQPGSNAPQTLTAHQLFEIYTCSATKWSQVGGKGKNAGQTIKPFIPQSSSGTRSFFLTAIGFTSTETPGPCVSDEATKADPGGRLEENEGVNMGLNQDKANVIFPYSIGKYLSQRYHSGKCLVAFCKTVTSGPNKGKVCIPAKGQNLFGCNMRGTMNLNKISNLVPTSVFPLPSKCGKTCPVVSSKFSPLFTRSLYIVVPYSTAAGNVNHIPPYMLPFFGPSGFTCTNSVAKTDLANYGFIVFPHGKGGGRAINRCGDTH